MALNKFLLTDRYDLLRQHISKNSTDTILKTRYQLIGVPRSGTTYYTRMLYHYIKYYNKSATRLGEIIRHDPDTEAPLLLELLQDTNVRVVKQHAQQLIKSLDYFDISVYKSFYNIGLVRRNFFDTVLSYTISSIKDEADEYSYTRNDTITINVDRFVNDIDTQFDNLINFYRISNMGIINKIIYYEDLKFVPCHDLSMLTENNRPLYSEIETTSNFIITKQAPDKKTLVLNYEELYNIALDYFKTKTDFSTKLYIDGINHNINYRLN